MEFDPSITYLEFRERWWASQPNPQDHDIRWHDLLIDGERFTQTMLQPKPNENFADIWYCASMEDAKVVGMQAFNSVPDAWNGVYTVEMRQHGSRQVWVRYTGMHELPGQFVDDRKLLRKR